MAVEGWFPQSKSDLRFLVSKYNELIIHHARQSRQGGIIVDAGGGQSCPFACDKPPHFKLVAVDISSDELEANADVDETIVSDISQFLPFEDNTVDIVASRMTIEHLSRTDGFISEAGRVLKAGGKVIILFPSRFAPFALLNQVIPHRISNKIVAAFHSDWRGNKKHERFETFYHNCYYSAFKSLVRRNGFDIVDEFITYAQSRYFDFFFPLYLASMTYESLIHMLKIRNLAAYILIVAEKTVRA
jgi:ubiquinone/menaquinone biosynthesis C-methylase UbiE